MANERTLNEAVWEIMKILDNLICFKLRCNERFLNSEVLRAMRTRDMNFVARAHHNFRIVATMLFENEHDTPSNNGGSRYTNRAKTFLISLEPSIIEYLLEGANWLIRDCLSNLKAEECIRYIFFTLYMLNSMPWSNISANYSLNIKKQILIFALKFSATAFRFEIRYHETTKEFMVRILVHEKKDRFLDYFPKVLGWIADFNANIAEDLRNDLVEVMNELVI